MKLTIDIPQELIKKLIYNVMQNQPEASRYGCCLRCRSFNYDKCEFDFHDCEEGTTKTVTYPMLQKGFILLIDQANKKKITFPGWNISPILNPTEEAWNAWACDWDADVIDALVQCAIFGEVIYG